MNTLDYVDLKDATHGIIIINVSMFIITSIMGRSLLTIGLFPLLLFGISVNTLKLGFYWTPLTSIFTHSGVFHIFSNMLYIYYVGTRLKEDGFTTKQIYLAYLITGIPSGIFSSLIEYYILQSNAIAVGASGSVFGLIGLYWGILRRARKPEAKNVLFFGIIMIILSAFIPNVGSIAHILGFISGMILGKSEFFVNLNRFNEYK